MDWIVIDGVKPYDGRYQLDASLDFSTREWGWIKRLAGYLPLNVEEAFTGGDPELFAVLALVALHRAGKVEARDVPGLYDRMLDSPFWTTIRFESDGDTVLAEEADADSPPPGSSTGNAGSSGAESTPSSETSPSRQNGSGSPGSDSSVYDPATWAT
jgi:hypothetical protein